MSPPPFSIFGDEEEEGTRGNEREGVRDHDSALICRSPAIFLSGPLQPRFPETFLGISYSENVERTVEHRRTDQELDKVFW
jgi:hypothetical protein